MAGRASTRRRPSGMRRDQRGGQALAGDVGGALADHLDPADAAVAQALAHRGGEHVVVERHLHPTVALHELAAQRLAEAGRRLGDLLQQEVRVGATVDVPRRDLRLLQVGLRHGQHGAVVGLAGDPVELAGAGAVEDDDLAPAGVRVLRVGGRVAVEPQVACGSARRGRTARRRRRSSRRPARRRAPGRCPAGRAAGGRGGWPRWRRSPPSPRSSPPCRGTPW